MCVYVPQNKLNSIYIPICKICIKKMVNYLWFFKAFYDLRIFV